MLTNFVCSCSSEVGRVDPGKGQDISLGEERCLKQGTVAHEAGHALGLWHEQSRMDRDEQ